MVERKKLGELLLEAKVINAAQLASAIAHQRQWGSRLGTALMEKGFVDEETLAKFLSQQRGMPSVVLGTMKIAPEILKKIPRELQEKHCLVPIGVEKVGNRETLVIAMADPSNLQSLDEVKFAIGGGRIKTVIAVEATIKKAITGDSRQFRPSVNPQAGGADKKEITDEFAVVRGTMEQAIITSGSTAVVPRGAPTGVVPGATPGRSSAGQRVDSAPIGEAELELEVDPEISEVEALHLDASDFEPIVTNVGPPPMARPAVPVALPVAPPSASAPDPFLDALRGPPRQPSNGAAAVAPPAARPVPAPAPLPPPPARSVPSPAAVTARAPVPVPGVSPFLAPDEDRTERDLPMAPPTPPAPEPAPEPFALGDAFPPESIAQSDPWPEPPAEPSFEPLAEAAPWPPVEENSASSPAYAEAPMPDGGFSDLGPSAMPLVAEGVSPLENSVPEISLPGPEMPEGVDWDSQGRVGAFDPDTAPETDLNVGLASGLFSIPSELEVQEGSIPGDLHADAPPSQPMTEPMEPMSEDAAPADPGFEPGFEPTAADEPMPEYVEPGFETAITSAQPAAEDPGGMSAESLAAEIPVEMPADTVGSTFETGVETMAPTEGDLAPFQSDPTMPEYEPTSPEPPPPEAEPEPAMTSSTAGMVPSMTAQESQEPVEATAIGSGHHEPTWDAPMEFTAPPEGSILAEGEIPSAAPVADQLRPRGFEEDRSSVTRESPFPMGTEAARGVVMLSPLHVEEPPPEPPLPPMDSVPDLAPAFAPEAEPEPEHEPTVFSAPQIEPTHVDAPEELAPPREETAVVPVVPSVDLSATGAAAAAAASSTDEQAALNTLVSKKLKLLNAITEILLEKGLITEDEIREKITKKKS